MTIEYELDKAGIKPTKEDRKAEMARQRVLDSFLGVEKKKTGYADPALMFG